MGAKSLSFAELVGSMRVATSIAGPASARQGWGGREFGELQFAELRFAELQGRLVELAGGGAGQLSLAAEWLLQAQQEREPVAWVHAAAAPPYPPDLAARSIDLAALAMVRVENDRAMLRAADQLLRSGAFGLVVLDYLQRPIAPLAAQVRLAGLCRQHDCTLLCLGPEPAFPMASLRASVERERRPDRFVCTVKIDKDKRRGREWQFERRFDGPVGMR
ncbi:MAG: recombinase A [bacterium]|nr:recombinase A [bacterium]